MYKYWFIAIVVAFIFYSCDGVESLINLHEAPELDDNGIIVSSNRVNPRDTVRASIHATNPEEGPLDYYWSCTGGNYIRPLDLDSVKWIAPVVGGSYTLKVKVSNEHESVRDEQEIVVVSSSKPLVDIMQPEMGQSFVMGQYIPIRVSADHENGIAGVKLYMNDQFVADLPLVGGVLYGYDQLKSDSTMVGSSTIKVEATAATALQPKDIDVVTVKIEGVIVGKQ